MTKIYECRTCGVVTEARQQVCDPRELENEHAYCGTTAPLHAAYLIPLASRHPCGPQLHPVSNG